MTREELRDAAISIFKDSHNIAIQAATGVGKSKIAIDLCRVCADKENRALKVLLLIAETAHYKNWEDEIKKWSFTAPIYIACYASMKKYRNTRWDVIIFDEAHHLGSELRLDLFDTLRAKYRIFLSATLKDSLLFRLEESCGPISNLKMGLQDAFSANILPEPKIKLIPLELDNTHYTETIVEEWGKKEKRLTATCMFADRWKFIRDKKRVPNGKLIIQCTQKQKYDYYCEQFEYYKKRYLMTRNDIIKNKWLQWGSKRKVYLGLLKTELAKTLVKKLGKKRYVCFCTNIEQAELLGGDNAIHSKKKDSLKIIEEFNNKQRSNIFAVGMLQEGMNLTDIQVGVIIQLDGEERAFIQKFGRTLRAESPVQYIIYYKGTRDEEYLQKAIESIDKKYIVTYEINN